MVPKKVLFISFYEIKIDFELANDLTKKVHCTCATFNYWSPRRTTHFLLYFPEKSILSPALCLSKPCTLQIFAGITIISEFLVRGILTLKCGTNLFLDLDGQIGGLVFFLS